MLLQNSDAPAVAASADGAGTSADAGKAVIDLSSLTPSVVGIGSCSNEMSSCDVPKINDHSEDSEKLKLNVSLATVLASPKPSKASKKGKKEL